MPTYSRNVVLSLFVFACVLRLAMCVYFRPLYVMLSHHWNVHISIYVFGVCIFWIFKSSQKYMPSSASVTGSVFFRSIYDRLSSMSNIFWNKSIFTEETIESWDERSTSNANVICLLLALPFFILLSTSTRYIVIVYIEVGVGEASKLFTDDLTE